MINKKHAPSFHDATADPTILCPNCHTEIKLTEQLAAPMVEQLRADFELKLEQQRESIAADEARKAKMALGSDLQQKERDLEQLRELVASQDAKLNQAHQTELDYLKKTRELEDARRELDVTIERRTNQQLATIREQVTREAADDSRMKLAERDEQIASMKSKIEDLQRKAEQGSQQLQGEAQEAVLESTLRTEFPFDSITPVAKGTHGGDVVQCVLGPTGRPAGTIIWESKRTKAWSDGWLAKLRDDQRAAGADVAVIVTRTLPKGVDGFACIGNVWVASPRVIAPLGAMLRLLLVEVSAARQTTEGQQTKTEMLYEYMTGARFRQHVQAIIEAFTVMKDDLEKERRAIQKQWAKREGQIARAMQATVSMYGDLEAIAGQSMQAIEGLEFPALGE